mgnify:CR=1 FL=1
MKVVRKSELCQTAAPQMTLKDVPVGGVFSGNIVSTVYNRTTCGTFFKAHSSANIYSGLSTRATVLVVKIDEPYAPYIGTCNLFIDEKYIIKDYKLLNVKLVIDDE